MRAKFKKGQMVRIIGKDVPPDTKYKLGTVKEIERVASGIRYIIWVSGSDRYFWGDELEKNY